MPVIMVNALELTEGQKRIMAQKYTEVMSELTNVPPDRVYVFFNDYPLNGIAAGGVLNSDVPDSVLKQFKVKYTEDLKAKEAISVISVMKAKPNCEEKAWEELTSLLIKTRAEEGCLSYDLFKSKYDLTNQKNCGSYFILKENWRDMAAIGFHTSTDFFKYFMGQAQELFDGPIEVTKCIESAKQFDLEDANNKVLTLTRVKAKSGQEEAVKQGLVDVMHKMQDRLACKMFDVCQGYEGIYDPSVLLSFQAWDQMKNFEEADQYLMEQIPSDKLEELKMNITFGMTSQPK